MAKSEPSARTRPRLYSMVGPERRRAAASFCEAPSRSVRFLRTDARRLGTVAGWRPRPVEFYSGTSRSLLVGRGARVITGASRASRAPGGASRRCPRECFRTAPAPACVYARSGAPGDRLRSSGTTPAVTPPTRSPIGRRALPPSSGGALCARSRHQLLRFRTQGSCR